MLMLRRSKFATPLPCDSRARDTPYGRKILSRRQRHVVSRMLPSSSSYMQCIPCRNNASPVSVQTMLMSLMNNAERFGWSSA